VEILHLNTWVLENVCLCPQDYIEDNDSLVLLHDQIHDCDIILSQIGSILSGFQVHIGLISSEIRSLQEKSWDISLNLRNRKFVETKLAGFVEEIVAPPSLVNILVNGEFLLLGK